MINMDDCIFCKVIAGKMPSHTVFENDDVLAFMDIRPVNPGHTLVVPKIHATDMRESSDQELEQVLRVVKKIAPAILKTVGADAFNFTSNVGRASGQIVFHTHFHIIPRFSTDGYKAWEREDGAHEDLGTLAGNIRDAIST